MEDFFFSYCLFLFSVLIFFFIKMLSNDYIVSFLCFILFFISFNFFFCWGFVYFIVFFELSSLMVIVMALMFGVQVEKVNAFYFFFLYNLVSFLPFLIVFLFLMKNSGGSELLFINFFLDYFFMGLTLFLFFVKFPLFFFHYWLPKIHVEASTFSSMLLASLLLKFGVFGLYRFLGVLKVLDLMVFYYIFFLGLMMSLLMSLIQSDLKSQIAYSSISHMSVVFFNLIVFSSVSEKFSFFVTIGHAFSSCLGFWFVGEIFHIFQSRLVMEVSSFFLGGFKFCVHFFLMLMLMGAFPFSLNYFTEYFMVVVLYKSVYFVFFFVWFFFFDFFFIIFLVTISFMGKKPMYSSVLFFVVTSLFLLWGFNFLFFFNNLL